MKCIVFACSLLLLIGCNEPQSTDVIFQTNNKAKSEQLSRQAETKRQRLFAAKAKKWCMAHHYNNHFFLLADMALPSGKKRLFIYDMQADSVVAAGLVAHGCCGYPFLSAVRFSNVPNSGCSSAGKYKIGGRYQGSYGTAYKLSGLDSSNSNAAVRNIVLHSYRSVPDEKVYPDVIGNSYGCVMVSQKFLTTLAQKIDGSAKPMLLWVAE